VSRAALRRLQETLRTLTEGDGHISVTVLRLYSPHDSYSLLRAVDNEVEGDKAIVLDLSTKHTYESLFRQVYFMSLLLHNYCMSIIIFYLLI
jgi:hypothetical protein